MSSLGFEKGEELPIVGMASAASVVPKICPEKQRIADLQIRLQSSGTPGVASAVHVQSMDILCDQDACLGPAQKARTGISRVIPFPKIVCQSEARVI